MSSSQPSTVFQPSAAVTSAVLIASVVSILATLFIVLSFVRHKILRRHPAELVLYRCLADALFCLVSVGSHIFLRSNAATTSGVDCKAFSFIAQATTLAGELYYLAMSIDLHLSMTNPFTNYRRNVRTYHFLTWSIALGSAVALLLVKINKQRCYGSDNFISVCWIRNFVDDTPSGAPVAPGSSTSRPISGAFWSFFFVPLVIIYSAALALLWKASRRLRQGLPETFEARVEIFRDTLRFNVGYLVFWAVALAVYALIALIDARNPSNFLSLLLALTFCSKGTVTALIWLLTFGKDLSFTCRRGCVPKAEIITAANKSGGSSEGGANANANAGASADLRPFLNVNLRREVLYYTTMGIAKSVARAARAGFYPGHPSSSDVDLDEDYGKYGIRVNVLWLNRRKEESGLFDLEANKAKSKQAVLAAVAPASSAATPGGRGQLQFSRSGRQLIAASPQTPNNNYSNSHNANNSNSNGAVVTGTIDAFLAWNSSSPAAGAATTPIAASSSAAGMMTSPGPKIPLSATGLVRPSIHRSASDMRVPLLSPAREFEVQEEVLRAAVAQQQQLQQQQQQSQQAQIGAAGTPASSLLLRQQVRMGGQKVDFEPSLRSAGRTTMSLNAPAAAAPSGASSLMSSPSKGGSRSASAYPRGGGLGSSHSSSPSSRTRLGGTSSASSSSSAAGCFSRVAGSLLGCCGSSMGLGGGIGGGGGSTTSLPRYKFTDFEPFLFRRLRLQAGISDLEYVLALSRTRREKFSEGASSQFFYFSTDERMLVKTLDKAEVDVLLSMLHSYSQYLSHEPHSLLPRFYGLHSITMYGTTFFFCVMANVLASGSASIQDRYDLKGSWVNRHRSPLEKGQRAECRYCGQRFRVGDGGNRFATDSAGKHACPARVNRPHEPNVVLKDNDLNAKLRLLPETAQALGDQIARDCDFLKSQGVMDYSLLLGVHRTKYKLVDVAFSQAQQAQQAQAQQQQQQQQQQQYQHPLSNDSSTSTATMVMMGRHLSTSSSSTHAYSRRLQHQQQLFPSSNSSLNTINTTGMMTNGYNSRAVSVNAPAVAAANLLHSGSKISLDTSGGGGGGVGAGGAGAGDERRMSVALHMGEENDDYDYGGGGGGGGGEAANDDGKTVTTEGLGGAENGNNDGKTVTTRAEHLSEEEGKSSVGSNGQANNASGGPGPQLDPRAIAGIMIAGTPDTTPRLGAVSGPAGVGGADDGFSLSAADTPRQGQQQQQQQQQQWGIAVKPQDLIVGSPGGGLLMQHERTRSLSRRTTLDLTNGGAAVGTDVDTGSVIADEEDAQGGVFLEDRGGTGAGSGVTGSGGAAAAAIAVAAGARRPPGYPPRAAVAGGGNEAIGPHGGRAVRASSSFTNASQYTSGSSYPLLHAASSSGTGLTRGGAGLLPPPYAGGATGAGAAALGVGSVVNANMAMGRIPEEEGVSSYYPAGNGVGGANGDDGDDQVTHVVIPFHREYRGGLRATVIEGPGIYFLGLIDTLQRFTWMKWFERVFKVYFLLKNGNGLSSMEPGGYAQRFKTRVLGQLLDGWKDATAPPPVAASTGSAGGGAAAGAGGAERRSRREKSVSSSISRAAAAADNGNDDGDNSNTMRLSEPLISSATALGAGEGGAADGQGPAEGGDDDNADDAHKRAMKRVWSQLP